MCHYLTSITWILIQLLPSCLHPSGSETTDESENMKNDTRRQAKETWLMLFTSYLNFRCVCMCVCMCVCEFLCLVTNELNPAKKHLFPASKSYFTFNVL